TAAAGQHGPAPENTGSPGPAVPATTGQSRASAPRIVLDGDERHFDFDQIQCDWGTDDGYPQLEYEAESHSEDAELEVEIVMSDPPTIDDFELEFANEEWEASDADRADAQITVDGDEYHVVSPVTSDDETQTVEMDVSFTCAGR